MSCLANIAWLLLGGIITAVEYFISGALMCLTIIGIPFGIQAFKLGILALWPFGSTITTRPEDGGCFNIFMNILWILLGGIWIAITHLVFGIICCITILFIPFGLQHFKLAALALAPFGKQIN